MAQTATTSFREIAKPKCPKCGISMWLLHIDPQLSCDQLTFECARCGAQELKETAPGASAQRA